MRWLLVVDPLERLKLGSDTSLALAEAAVERGHEVEVATLDDLSVTTAPGSWALQGAEPLPPSCELRIRSRRLDECRPLAGVVRAGEPVERGGGDFDVAVMRKDPPFDMEYIYATYMLDLAQAAGALVVNGPAGLRECNEKVYALRFPELCPPSVLTRSKETVLEALDAWGGKAVLKPLDMMGGRGVVMLDREDPNLEALVEMSLFSGTKRGLVQAFVEDAWQGDKRILAFDDEVLGVFVRKPKPGDFRGNLSVGASAEGADLTDRDREILARILPDLASHGQRFVGVDVIGRYITEVNVTSPMGLRELDAVGQEGSSRRLAQLIEAAVEQRRG
jgi:glutathione synthase